MRSTPAKRWTRMARSQAGFTLAELLVVVAIVVGLAAVILPNVGRFTGEGERGALATELASVQTALDAFAADPANTLNPSTAWANTLLAGTFGANGVALAGYLRLPDGALITADRYCWDADGTVRQESTTSVAGCP